MRAIITLFIGMLVLLILLFLVIPYSIERGFPTIPEVVWYCPPPYTVEAPPEIAGQVRWAMSVWNASVGREVFVTDKTAHSVQVSVKTEQGDVGAHTAEAYMYSKRSDHKIDSADIKIYPLFWEQPGGLQHRALLHEFGHILGLDHTDDPGCAMHKTLLQSESGDLCGQEIEAAKKQLVGN